MNNGEDKTPARVNLKDGTIEIPKSLFNKNSDSYHEFKVNKSPFMVYHELIHIEGNIKHRINLTNKRIKGWIDYADKQLHEYRRSEDALIICGKIFKRDDIFSGTLLRFKIDLIKRFWWRLGIFGIKERWKYFKMERVVKKGYKKRGL